jgi:hypothetical protein
MNNPGIDLANWERLRKRWSELESGGNELTIHFSLITASETDTNVLAIDVVQNLNDEVIIETIQRNPGEAYAILGIDGLSIEELVGVYKDKMRQLQRQANQKEADLIVTMSPTSSTSGEIRGGVGDVRSEMKCNVLVNYQHYYLLTALREKMMALTGDNWSKVKALYDKSGDLEFYFEY